MCSGTSEWASDRTNERSRARERSEKCGASEWVSSASERANGGANGSVLYASISYHLKPLCILFRGMDSFDLHKFSTPPLRSKALPPPKSLRETTIIFCVFHDGLSLHIATKPYLPSRNNQSSSTFSQHHSKLSLSFSYHLYKKSPFYPFPHFGTKTSIVIIASFVLPRQKLKLKFPLETTIK